MERYGVENASSSDRIKARRRDSCIEKYGVDNPAKSEKILEKIKNTNMRRYGCECSLYAPSARLKTAATIVERYGVASFSKTDEFRKKTKRTNREKFGVDYPNQDPKIRRMSQKRYVYRDLNFDSAPELAFYIFAEDHGLGAEYQPDVSFTYEFEGKTYAYQPDFRVGGKLIEFKGRHFFENKDPSRRMINPYDRSQDGIYEAKRLCMVKNGVRIVTDREYRKYMDYVDSVYGKGYLKQFKNR